MNNKLQEIAKELARKHADYVIQLLDAHDIDMDMDIIRFHYETAFVHGFKHGVEEIKKEACNENQGGD